MKKFKGMVMILLVIAIISGVVACGDAPIKGSLKIDDITLDVDQSVTIVANFEPQSVKKDIKYSFSGNNIAIVSGVVKGIVGGTSTIVTATADDITTTFKVNVKEKVVVPPATDEGSLLFNGGFESGAFDPWTVSGSANVIEKSDEDNNNVISGNYGVKLYVSSAIALDFTIKQPVKNVAKGKYTYSAKVKGNFASLTLFVLEGDTTLETKTFTNISSTEVRQLGLKLDLSQKTNATNITVGATFAGAAGVWGGADDFMLEEGDKSLPNYQTEESANSFVKNGGFEMGDFTAWNITLSGGGDKAVNVDATKYGNKKFAYWAGASGSAFNLSQEIDEIPTTTKKATLSVWVSGENDTIETFNLFAESGAVTKNAKITTTGYESGYVKYTIEDITIVNNRCKIGVDFAKTSTKENYWCNIDAFELLIDGVNPVKSAKTSFSNIMVSEVSVANNAVTLPTAKFVALSTAAADCKTFVSGTLSYGATINSAVFNTQTGVLTVNIMAENGSTNKNYTITVTQIAAATWVNIPLLNASFEDADEPTSWTLAGFKDQLIIKEDAKNTGYKGINAWDKLTNAQEATIKQDVSREWKVGDKVRLSVFINSASAEADIKLLIGANATSVTITTAWNFYQISAEHTLTAADIANGKITIGASLTAKKEGATVKLDDFKLEILE